MPRARAGGARPSPTTTTDFGRGALACFAIAAPGLEPLVARELGALPVRGVREVVGGVEFTADAAGLAAAQLRLRTASRVLVRLASFKATAFHELERSARHVPWASVLPPDAPFALRVTCRKSRLYHSDAVAERVAAAIVRSVAGARPAERSTGAPESDDLEDADAMDGTIDAVGVDVGDAAPARTPQLFVVRFDRDRCTISADASGELLHRRGYRQAVARAPMRETLAAALVMASGWDPATPLLDPFCGSGTIPIEAALIARRIAPGLERAFAAERWPSTASGVWAAARAAAAAEVLPSAPAPILGSDRDAGAIEAAKANAERAGVAGDVTFTCAALMHAEPPAERGTLVSNPPYGVRVGDAADLGRLYAALGDLVRARFPKWDVTLVVADRVELARTRLAFAESLSTRNGGLSVQFQSRRRADE